MPKNLIIFYRKASTNCLNYIDFAKRTYLDYKNFVENNSEISLIDSSKHCFIEKIKDFDIFFAFKSGIYLLDPISQEKNNIYMVDIDFIDIKNHIRNSIDFRSNFEKKYITKILNDNNLLIKSFTKYIETYCNKNNINYLLSLTDNGLHLYIVDPLKSETEDYNFIKNFNSLSSDDEKISFLMNNNSLKLFYELYCDPSCACNLLPHYRLINGKKKLVAKQLHAVRASQKPFIPFKNKGYSTKFVENPHIYCSVVEKKIKTNLKSRKKYILYYNYISQKLFKTIEKIKNKNIEIWQNTEIKEEYKQLIKNLKVNYKRKDFNIKGEIATLQKIFRTVENIS